MALAGNEGYPRAIEADVLAFMRLEVGAYGFVVLALVHFLLSLTGALCRPRLATKP